MPEPRFANPLRTVVVDDEPPARRKLMRWLSDDDSIELTAACADGYEALDVLASKEVDLLFLDVQMPELSGFDVLRQCPASAAPVVVFATAHDTYAIDAFQHHAAGYLLKPYDRPRFDATLAQAKAQHAGRSPQTQAQALASVLGAVQPSAYLKHIAARAADRVDLVRVAEVDWMEASGNYVVLHTGGQQHLVRETLTRLAARLDPQQFVRIHRSTVVNIDRVASLLRASHGDYTVTLRDGTLLPMSRTYKEQLRDVLAVGF
ncbi:MAG: LytTR family DNA-binding domain-containing protein [Rhodothermales bacterium]